MGEDAGPDASTGGEDGGPDATTGGEDGGPDATTGGGDAGLDGATLDDAASGTDAAPLTRLVYPMAGAITNTQQPTVRVSVSAGASGAILTACSDRACANPVWTGTVKGTGLQLVTAGSSAHPLAGNVYWMAQSLDATGVAVGGPSPIWSFHAPRSGGASTAVATVATPSYIDVDGDGFGDAVFDSSCSATSSIQQSLGGSGGVATTPAGAAIAESAPTYPLGGGDFDGDGKTDVLLSEGGNGVVDLYLGAAGGLTRASSIASSAWKVTFDVGDVDGDGYGDIPVVSYASDPTYVSVAIYPGNAAAAVGDTLEGEVASPIALTAGPFAGAYPAGDVNGDGYADFALATTDGRIVVYYGQLGTGLCSTLDTCYSLLTPPSGVSWTGGAIVTAAGDVNLDGYGDLVVWRQRAVGATLFYGNFDGLSSSPVTLSYGGYTLEGLAVMDVNGDGAPDLLTDPYTLGTSELDVFLGDPAGGAWSSTSAGTLGVLSEILALGDTDGDGFADLAYGAGASSSTTYVVYGNATYPPPPSNPITSLAGACSAF